MLVLYAAFFCFIDGGNFGFWRFFGVEKWDGTVSDGGGGGES